MELDKFLFKDYYEKFSENFIRNGEITIYYDESNGINHEYLFSAIIPNTKIDQINKDSNWDISTKIGHPSIIYYYTKENEKLEYLKYGNKIFEPIVLERTFGNGIKSYIEISQEFRLYYNLIERKNNEITDFIHINEDGDEVKIVSIAKDNISVKINFLFQFLYEKDCSLVIFFDLMRFTTLTLQELNLNVKREEVNNAYEIYFHLIENSDFHPNKAQSWILGKLILRVPEKFIQSHLNTKKQYTDYLININEFGIEEFSTCNEEFLANYYGKNEGAHHYLTPVYFRREVLNKYYNEPNKYEVQDGIINANTWDLRIDNNNSNYIVVFLGDLGYLSYKEQLYWKSYNYFPSGNISFTSFNRNFKGEFTDPEQPDLYFKQRFEMFQNNWFKKFNWYLFKPLNLGDIHHFKSIHIPGENNQKEFDEQVLSITKIIIDSLNEEILSISINQEKLKTKSSKEELKGGINKLAEFLEQKELKLNDMINFLRNLQTLRSSSVAHRKSENKKDLQKVIKYFELKEKGMSSAYENILIKVIWTLNTLESQLVNSEKNSHNS